MVVFLDTSALYALANRDDPNHDIAVTRLERATSARESLLVHNYVVLEAASLIQRRLGWVPAEKFLEEVTRFEVEWVGKEIHTSAVERYRKRRGRYSLVDEVSFLVMRRQSVRYALAFDEDFVREGFQLYEA